MWSIASHAGTGLAVAGLSATYYALARKTYQLERESFQSSHHADKDSGDASTNQISPSQLLLKKEMGLIGRNSGHVIGLNVVTSTSNLHSQFNFPNNLRNIRSRFEHLDCKSTEECPNSPKETKQLDQPECSTNLSSSGSLNSLSAFGVEEFSSLEFSGDSQPLPSASPTAVEEISQLVHETACSSPDTRDNFSSNNMNNLIENIHPIRKTESPFVFYKNPGFTNEEQQSTVMLFHTKDNLQKNEVSDTINRQLSNIDDIRDYNLKLIEPRNQCITPENSQAEKLQEHKIIPSKSWPEIKQKVSKTEDNEEEEEEKNKDCSIPPNSAEEILEEIAAFLNTDAPTSEVQIIDERVEEEDQMASFMERISKFSYFQPERATESVITSPSEDSFYFTIIFISCVVLVFGLIGRFVVTISDWLIEMQSALETEDNPAAVIDH